MAEGYAVQLLESLPLMSIDTMRESPSDDINFNPHQKVKAELDAERAEEAAAAEKKAKKAAAVRPRPAPAHWWQSDETLARSCCSLIRPWLSATLSGRATRWLRLGRRGCRPVRT
jgi:hypothetical protein